MTTNFNDDELSKIEKMADIANVDVKELKRIYTAVLEANFYEDMQSAINHIKEIEENEFYVGV